MAALTLLAGHRTLWARLLPFAWMALIFIFSSLQSPRVADEPLVDLLLKKAGHFVLYAVLALVVAVAVSTTRWARWAVVVASVAAVAFALSDEFHQIFTPTRWPSWADVLIDVAGAAVGVALFGWLARRSGRSGRSGPAGSAT